MAYAIAESTNYQNFYRMYRATNGGTTYTLVTAGTTVFDYFDDACVVNDAFYFGYKLARWREVRLFVGTAFAAAAVTFVWEYYGRFGWTALAGVVDGTANFTALGQGDVTFTVPTNLRNVSVSGAYAMWMRVRITAVTAPTEGGAQSTQTAQLRDHEILVTGVDTIDVFQAVYDADQAGVWGHTSYSNRGIQITCGVGIGDGTILTSVKSTNEYVDISYDDFRVRNNATLQCGTLHANGYTYEGSVIHISGKSYQDTILTEAGSTAYFYDTRLLYSGGYGGSRWMVFQGTPIFQDATFNFGGGRFQPYTEDLSLRRVRNKQCRFFPRAAPSLVEDFYCQGETTNLCTLNQDSIITGLVLESGLAQPLRGYDVLGAQLIDSGTDPLDAAKWSWGSLSVGDYLLVRYTFNLRVVDAAGTGISGVTVAMTDVNGDAVFSAVTDVNGDIAEQTVTRVRYDYLTATTMTQTDYGPGFTVTLSLAGRITRTIVYTMDRKREEIEELLPKGMKKDIGGRLYAEINSVGDLLRIA